MYGFLEDKCAVRFVGSKGVLFCTHHARYEGGMIWLLGTELVWFQQFVNDREITHAYLPLSTISLCFMSSTGLGKWPLLSFEVQIYLSVHQKNTNILRNCYVPDTFCCATEVSPPVFIHNGSEFILSVPPLPPTPTPSSVDLWIRTWDQAGP